MTDVRTAVVGAGIAGLAAAAEAQQFGSVAVLEASGRVGGTIRSYIKNGYSCEEAAASTPLPASGTSTLIATIGVSKSLAPAEPCASRRWFCTRRGLVELPASPLALCRSRLISPWAKLGALAEPFAASAPEGEESVADFLARHFGAEVAAAIAQPIVAGIYGGQASRLSVDATFPLLRELERDGGVLRAGLRRFRARRQAGIPRTRLHTFRGGMEVLPRAIADWLGDAVHLNTPVREVRRDSDVWRITSDDVVLTADRLLLASAPAITADLVSHIAPNLAEQLREIPRAPIAVVHVGVERDVLRSHEGFGFLAHPSSRLRILGAVFDSMLFADQAPPGKALLRVMVGGAPMPRLMELDDTELIAIVTEDLSRALGRDVAPEWSHIVRHTEGIPQYELGHMGRLRAIDSALAALGGVDVCGWGYRGIGVNSGTADAIERVRKLLSE